MKDQVIEKVVRELQEEGFGKVRQPEDIKHSIDYLHSLAEKVMIPWNKKIVVAEDSDFRISFVYGNEKFQVETGLNKIIMNREWLRRAERIFEIVDSANRDLEEN